MVADPVAAFTTVYGLDAWTIPSGFPDLKAVFKALPAAYRRNATWLINADDFAEIAALTLHSDNGHVGYRAASREDGRPLLADAARILAHSAT